MTEEVAPGYSSVVREPIALCTIRTRLQRRQYRTLPEFKHDLLLMAHNALLYNHATDLPYKLAARLATLVLNLITRVRYALLSNTLLLELDCTVHYSYITLYSI